MSRRQSELGFLTIDLEALAANWRLLSERARLGSGGSCDVAGVVKANGYGIGARLAVPALQRAGCKTFFVATPDEAFGLIDLIEPPQRLFLLSGLPAGEGAEALARELLEAGIRPVLNDPEMIARWSAVCLKANRRGPAALHFDTGMTRLGLTPLEARDLIRDRAPLGPMVPELLMTHPACADEPDHALNAAQRQAFLDYGRQFPDLPLSYCNSSALFGPSEQFLDLARPGIALYGGNPTPWTDNPMHPVVRLRAKVLQIRQIDTPKPVGYGATHMAAPGQRLATVGVGYADGLLRSLSGRGMGVLGGVLVPMVGRVSMDLIVFDVSAVPENLAHPGALIDLIGPGHSLDDLAAEAGTIPYEILTSLGARYARAVLPDQAAGAAAATGADA
ncbi:MAG: alanine racemase [Rhodospirillaceae bacterium]